MIEHLRLIIVLINERLIDSAHCFRVKARHGVRVIGAEPRNSSVWKITLDLNHKLHGAMVTASAVSKSPYNRCVVSYQNT